MSLTQTDRFELGNQRVDIVRSPRARRLRLAVDPRSGRVRLTVPKRTSLHAAIAWAHDHHDWVAGQAAKLPKAQPIQPDMILTVGGESLRLEWTPALSRIPKRTQDAVRVGGDLAGLNARLTRWLKREALRILDAETREFALLAGVVVGRVGVGDPVGRWGSCSSKGDIRYSWRLILAPPDVRRATVAHEVAHRVHMNHSAAFHALVAELYGREPQAERRWLVANGAALHWFGKA